MRCNAKTTVKSRAKLRKNELITDAFEVNYRKIGNYYLNKKNVQSVHKENGEYWYWCFSFFTDATAESCRGKPLPHTHTKLSKTPHNLL